MKISRLNSLEQYILLKDTVSIDELCEVFNVSKNTIRRDLNELEARGHIVKVYGGVTTVQSKEVVPMPVRSTLNSANKSYIGKVAANIVQDGDTIFLDSGTTTSCIIKYLSNLKKITIISHSLNVLLEASKFENINIISLGGLYNGSTGSFVGISTLENISNLRITKAFMAATGVSIESGLTSTTFLEAEIKRGVVTRSKEVYLMADTTKLDHDAVITYCPISSLTGFITDSNLPQKYIDYCKLNNVKIYF